MLNEKIIRQFCLSKFLCAAHRLFAFPVRVVAGVLCDCKQQAYVLSVSSWRIFFPCIGTTAPSTVL